MDRCGRGSRTQPFASDGAAANQVEDTSLPHVRGSQGVSQGLRIYQVRPIYPTRGLQDRIQGTVVLRAHISKEGNVQDLKLVSGHPVLAPAAIEAVKQSKYKPYFLSGEPVDYETTVNVNFTLAAPKPRPA